MVEHVHIYVHIEPDRMTLAALDRIEAKLGNVSTGVEHMALDFTNLESEVQQNSDAIDSAATLLTNLAEEIRASAGDPAALEALATQLDANTARLAAAVTANTPSSGGGEPPA